ncbi:DUF4238 domain-containing protein [Rhizobium acaciae]|uniref:DUF4238 domain-containing protein n=1 Tax=Rhizobium acaciae TaxID=2989736 RepID=UPI003F9C73FF
MALDHYVSQVHLKKFYAPELGERMYAIRKDNLKTYQCDAYSQCRVEEGSSNPYLLEPRIIEDFLKDVEPRYTEAVERLRVGDLDPNAIFAIVGFAAYVESCSPAGMRIHSIPIRKNVELLAEMLEKGGKLPPSPPELGGKLLSELLATGEVNVTIDPKYPQSIGIQTIVKRLSIWGNSWWDIIFNEERDSPFFTSDFPVALEAGTRAGFVNRILPLSPDLAVRIIPDLAERKILDLEFQNLRIRRVRATKRMVRSLNQAIVRSAETTVYSSTNRPWVLPFIAKNSAFHIEPKTMVVPYGEGQMLVASMALASKIV